LPAPAAGGDSTPLLCFVDLFWFVSLLPELASDYSLPVTNPAVMDVSKFTFMSAEDLFGAAEEPVFNGTVKMLEGDGESLLGKTIGFLRSLLRDKVVEGKEAEVIKKLSLSTTSKA
ncbi:hypothetical protein B484DRAFT_439614, partial [Ochromonadaceae sp. CCMP2298]